MYRQAAVNHSKAFMMQPAGNHEQLRQELPAAAALAVDRGTFPASEIPVVMSCAVSASTTSNVVSRAMHHEP